MINASQLVRRFYGLVPKSHRLYPKEVTPVAREMVYERARRDAKRIDEDFGDGYLPFDIEAVADALGIDVIFTRDLPANVSGMIIKEESDERATALISSYETGERQRFTLAHEVGHFSERMLARNDQDFSFQDNRHLESSDLHEFYANEFAGTLLMPSGDIRNCQKDGMTEQQLARRYGVTLGALRRRLERLERHEDLAS